MGIVYWVVFGLISGTIVRFLMPGRVRGGCLVTMVLGIVGAVVGGAVSWQLGFGDLSGFDLRSMIIAIGGGVLVLYVYSFLQKRQ